MAEEFLRGSEAQAGPSSVHGAFEFNALGQELELLDGPPPLPLEAMAMHQNQGAGFNNNWSHDFVHKGHVAATTNRPEQAEWHEFDRAFNAAQTTSKYPI
jgi:hypothetical protein